LCREESGGCYALDIGGTNFRVAYYQLSDKHGKVVSAPLDEHLF
jgi:hexokinase